MLLQELQKEICTICLNTGIIEEGSASVLRLYEICKQLLTFINTLDEYKKTIKDLPLMAREIITSSYISGLIDKVSNSEDLLDILKICCAASIKKEFLNVCEEKVSNIIKTDEDLINILDKLYYDQNQQEFLITVLGKQLKDFIQSRETLILVLEKINPRLQGDVIEAIRLQLNSIIISPDDLSLVLKKMGDVSADLKNDLIKDFLPRLKKPKQFIELLRCFSGEDGLQEKLINLLVIEKRLDLLAKNDKKTDFRSCKRKYYTGGYHSGATSA